MATLEARIIYRDDAIIIVDKPAGLLVHPNPHERGADTCLRQLRDVAGDCIHTVHRIDRATSGLVLFAVSRESASGLGAQFRERSIRKRYLAVVRGHLLEPRTIDHPVAPDVDREPVPSSTRVAPLSRTILHEPVGRYDEGWFTLVDVDLLTGRMHQARKHLHHIDHPVIGDQKHGDRAQNRFFVQRFAVADLFLRAYSLRFAHPVSGAVVVACSGLTETWLRVMAALGLEAPADLPRESSVKILP